MTSIIQITNLNDQPFVEDSELMRRSFAMPLSSFLNTIQNVISVISLKQMCRVTAWRIIAFVADVHSFFNFADGNRPSHPVCKHSFNVISHWIKHSIPTFVALAIKWPTFIRIPLLNIFPESFFNGNQHMLPPSCKRATVPSWKGCDVSIGICEFHIGGIVCRELTFCQEP